MFSIMELLRGLTGESKEEFYGLDSSDDDDGYEREPERSDPVDGWKERHTPRYVPAEGAKRNMLVNTDSDEGDHFTFTPSAPELHATFPGLPKKDRHVPIYYGLGAITEWEALRQSCGLEKTTELEHRRTSYTPPEPSFDVTAFMERQKNQAEIDEICREAMKKDRSSSRLSSSVTPGMFGTSRERDEDDRPTPPVPNTWKPDPIKLDVPNYPQYGSRSRDRSSAGSSLGPNWANDYFTKPSKPALWLDLDAHRAEREAERDHVASLRDTAYQLEGDRIRESMKNTVLEIDVLKSIMPNVNWGKRPEPCADLPGLTRLADIGAPMRSFSPGELCDIRGLPNYLR
ncbi:MAG: hypothetical protein ABIG30_00855 [Candidatus Aenigmatarchaeota archaeon]